MQHKADRPLAMPLGVPAARVMIQQLISAA
jgi:hypothetical protein